MEYFFNKNDSLSVDQVVGYFDFAGSGVSGLINIPSENWTNSNVGLQLLSSGGFWNYSGFANFNKQNYAKLTYVSGNSLSFIFTYKLKNDTSDNVFIANSDYISGVNFGINYAGYPYLEYYHKLYGPVIICHTSRANTTGVVNFSIDESNLVSVGLFDAESSSFQKILNSFDTADVKKSNEYYIGGSPNLETGRFLSADISEIFIYNPNYINSNIFENEFLSVMTYSIASSTVTGIISGQTGVLNGDIIKINQCSAQISGVLTGVVLATGSGEYFATHDSFLDFNNEVFNNFVQKIYTGYFSGYSTGEFSFLVCSDTITGKNTLEFESGYLIQYSITNTSASLTKPEYIYDYHNQISLLFNLDKSDILSIYGYSGLSSEINFFNIYYINADNSYGYDSEIGENFSGLYYNGQLQTRSSEYLEIIQSGNIAYEPSRDYLISGNKIFSNSKYGKIEENNSLIDFWPNSAIVITGKLNSGEQIFGINFSNSLVYFNGQLLNSGIDYSGQNTILRNIDSGYNILTLQENYLGLQNNTVVNSSGSVFSVPFNFNKKMSLVWLNGQRLHIDRDYVEFKKGSKTDIITQNTGVIIYNLEF